MRSVVIVDDHPVLASSVSLILASEKIADATTIEPWEPDAEQKMIDLKPDLCLLDLDLGHHQAAGMRFAVAAINAGLDVLMFTGSQDEVALGRCIEAGALGVIQKKNGFDEVLDSVRRVLDGGKCNSDTELLRWVLAAQRHEHERQRLLRPFTLLTNRESSVLQHLIDGLRAEEIAEADYVSVATIRTHIRSVLRKLEVKSQLQAVAKTHAASWSNKGADGAAEAEGRDTAQLLTRGR